MKTKSNLLLLSFGIAACMAALPSKALADRVVCESEHDHKRFCEMDTRGGVHVYRNLSKTDCVEGVNWGGDSRGVWVKDGCRAEFVSGDPDWERHHHHDHYRDEAPPPPQQTLHCPPGTHPSTHRCTQEERHRGCKDYGGPNGQGCSNF
jgi:hypothetical protein